MEWRERSHSEEGVPREPLERQSAQYVSVSLATCVGLCRFGEAWAALNWAENLRLLNARFILGSYYELRPPKSVARERYASVLQYKHTGCGGRGDLKTGQHARQAARRASHDTQERRLSFRYTRESIKVLCCVTTPAPYAVGRSMCMHLSKHLSPSPFRPHIALAWT